MTKFLATVALSATGAAATRALPSSSRVVDTYAGTQPANPHAGRTLLQNTVPCTFGPTQPLSVSPRQCYEWCITKETTQNACMRYLPQSVLDEVSAGFVTCGPMTYDWDRGVWTDVGGPWLYSGDDGCKFACESDWANNLAKNPTCARFNTAPAPAPKGPIGATGYPGFCADVLVTAGTQTVVAGETVNVMACDGASTQQWTLGTSDIDNNKALMVNGLCLDIVGGAATAGSFLNVASCNGAGSQQWVMAGDYKFKPSADLSLCVDVLNKQVVNYMPLVLQSCDDSATQSWTAP